MSKIYIRGRDTIETDKDIARSIKEQWILEPKSKDIVEASGETFKLRDIKSISIEEDFIEKTYDLDNEEDRREVKELEEEYLEWVEDKDYNSSLAWLKFLEMKGAIKLPRQSDLFFNYSISDGELYRTLNKLWAQVQLLRQRRTKAENIQKESFKHLKNEQ